MSDLFELYQDNLKSLFIKLSKQLNEFEKTEEDKDKLINEIESELKESEKGIKNLELQSAISDKDPNYSQYIKNYKMGYEQYRKKFLKLKDNYNNQKKAMLLTSDTGLYNSEKMSNSSEEIAYNSFNKLQNARRSTIEMESIGGDVMKDLESQNYKMKDITNKVGEVGDQLTTSTALIREIEKRQKRNKNMIIIFGIILSILFIIIALFRIIPKFIPNKNNPSTPIPNEQNQNFTTIKL